LAVDDLNKMIQKGVRAGYLEGLGPSDNSHEKIFIYSMLMIL
jgi:hypothetical protein